MITLGQPKGLCRIIQACGGVVVRTSPVMGELYGDGETSASSETSIGEDTSGVETFGKVKTSGGVETSSEGETSSRMQTPGGRVVARSSKESQWVLMIFRNGLWDLPKGKLEPGESRKECALREVSEEIGYAPVNGWKPGAFLGVTDHQYELKGELIEKWTNWWVFEWTESDEEGEEADVTKFVPQSEEGITLVEWMSLDTAIEKAGFENLRTVLRTLRANKQ